MIPIAFFAIMGYLAYIRISDYISGKGDLF